MKIFSTDKDKTTIIIRIMVGAVFVSEGIQKFIYPAVRGAGRFDKIGFPEPEVFASIVGSFEVLCGLLVLLGFLTRIGAFFLLMIMTVAIVVTKIPIFYGESFGPFNLRELSTYGFWSMAHEMRTDWAMWLGSFFLIIKGSGKYAIDRMLESKRY